MKKINNKGFTLVELIATVVILSLVITIGAVSITTIIKTSKEKDYELLVKEIKNAAEEFYIECNFASNSNIDSECQNSRNLDGSYQVELIKLVSTGFLKGNSADKNNNLMIINPLDNNSIGDCKIKYTYQKDSGVLTVEAINQTGSCPTSY